MKRQPLLLTVFLALAAAAPRWTTAIAQASRTTWRRDASQMSRTIGYSATVTLLRRPVPIDVRFYCNPVRTATSVGAIGFELEIGEFERLTAFHFADIEGPYAPTHSRRLMTATLLRHGSTVRSLRFSPAGWRSVRGGFVLELSDDFDARRSIARTTLEEIRDKADALRISVVDPRSVNVKLEFTIPITEHHDDFVWLLQRR